MVLFAFNQMLPDWAGYCKGHDKSPAVTSRERLMILPAAGKPHATEGRSRSHIDNSSSVPTTQDFNSFEVPVCY